MKDQSKKYIIDGKGSLLSRANKIKDLGAKTKVELDINEWIFLYIVLMIKLEMAYKR